MGYCDRTIGPSEEKVNFKGTTIDGEVAFNHECVESIPVDARHSI